MQHNNKDDLAMVSITGGRSNNEYESEAPRRFTQLVSQGQKLLNLYNYIPANGQGILNSATPALHCPHYGRNFEGLEKETASKGVTYQRFLPNTKLIDNNNRPNAPLTKLFNADDLLVTAVPRTVTAANRSPINDKLINHNWRSPPLAKDIIKILHMEGKTTTYSRDNTCNRQNNTNDEWRIKEHRLHSSKLILPQDKDWSELGIAVYRVGVAMYHSSKGSLMAPICKTYSGVVVDTLEWHFWEGLGVESLPRFFDVIQGCYVSVDHVPFVKYVAIDTLMISPRKIAQLCVELGNTLFSMEAYDIIRCNCNHFTAAVLERLGLQSRMPLWINRLASTTNTVCTVLPFVRTWIDMLLNRRSIINRDVPDTSENPIFPISKALTFEEIGSSAPQYQTSQSASFRQCEHTEYKYPSLVTSKYAAQARLQPLHTSHLTFL